MEKVDYGKFDSYLGSRLKVILLHFGLNGTYLLFLKLHRYYTNNKSL